MTVKKINAISAPTLLNLIATPTIGGVTLLWEIPVDVNFASTQIWAASTNDRSLSSLIADDVIGTTYFHQLDTGLTRYYWIRAKSVYGRTDGAWEPSSPTAGISATTSYVQTTDIATSAVTETTIYSSDAGISFTGAYNTPENLTTISLVGTGNTFLFDSYAQITNRSSTSYTTTAMSQLNFVYTLTNTDAGGSDLDTGWVTFNQSAYADFGAAGADFSSINNAKVADGTFTSGTASSGAIDDLFFYDFSFGSIPDDATITDIQVQVKAKYTSGSGTPSFQAYLGWDGASFSSTDGALASGAGFAQNLTGTNTAYTFGGSTFLRSSWVGYKDYTDAGANYRPITTADVKNSNFGIILYLHAAGTTQINIDYVAMKVYYNTANVVKQLIVPVLKVYEFATNDMIVETYTPINSFSAVLEDGVNYDYTIDWIRSTVGSDTVGATCYDRVTTVRELKR